MIASGVAPDEPGDVGAVLDRGQVVACPFRARRLEPVGMPDRPRGHEAAVGAAEDAEPGRVDPVETFAGRVDAGHHVLEIDAAPSAAGIAVAFGPTHRPAPLLAVSGTSAGVAVQDAEAGGGLELELIHEPVAVLRERTAVNVQQRRVLLARACTGRRHRPAFDLAAVGGPSYEPLRRAHADRCREWVRQPGEGVFLARSILRVIGAEGLDEQLARAGGRASCEGQRSGGPVPFRYPAVAADDELWLPGPVGPGLVQVYVAAVFGQEQQMIADPGWSDEQTEKLAVPVQACGQDLLPPRAQLEHADLTMARVLQRGGVEVVRQSPPIR